MHQFSDRSILHGKETNQTSQQIGGTVRKPTKPAKQPSMGAPSFDDWLKATRGK